MGGAASIKKLWHAGIRRVLFQQTSALNITALSRRAQPLGLGELRNVSCLERCGVEPQRQSKSDCRKELLAQASDGFSQRWDASSASPGLVCPF